MAGRAPGLSCAACATSVGKAPGVALAARERLFLQVPLGLQCVALAAAGGDLGGNTHCGSGEQEQLVSLLPAVCLSAVVTAGFYGCSLCSPSRLFYGHCVPAATPPMSLAFESLGAHGGMWWAPRAAHEREGLGGEVGT